VVDAPAAVAWVPWRWWSRRRRSEATARAALVVPQYLQYPNGVEQQREPSQRPAQWLSGSYPGLTGSNLNGIKIVRGESYGLKITYNL